MHRVSEHPVGINVVIMPRLNLIIVQTKGVELITRKCDSQ